MSQEIILIIALIVVAGVTAYLVLGKLADAGSEFAGAIQQLIQKSVQSISGAGSVGAAIVAAICGVAVFFVSPFVGFLLFGYAAYKFLFGSSSGSTPSVSWSYA